MSLLIRVHGRGMLALLRARRGRPAAPPVAWPDSPDPDLAAVAQMINAACLWAEDQIAGGQPARWVTQQLIAASRYAASYAGGDESEKTNGMATTRFVPVRLPEETSATRRHL